MLPIELLVRHATKSPQIAQPEDTVLERNTMKIGSKRVGACAFLVAIAFAIAPSASMAASVTSDVQQQRQLLQQIDAQPLGQTGYDGYLCNAPSTGVAIRDIPSDGGQERGRMYNGNPLHVYRTHNSEPSIPVGWALGYGRPGGGAAVNGYFKLAYVCT